MRKLTVPVPSRLGDLLYDPPPITELQPRFVRAATVMGRWGMSPKTFKALLDHGVLKPWIRAPGLVLFNLLDVLKVEREGWDAGGGLPYCEDYPQQKER